MTVLSDKDIAKLCDCEHPMLDPFINKPVKVDENGNKVISYGNSAHGYDIRLGPKFKRFVSNSVINFNYIDPKKVVKENFVEHTIEKHLIIAPGEYILGISVEKFNMPRDVIAFTFGKSTYARSGLLINCPPADAGWSGYLTIQIANLSLNKICVYPNEGIAQVVFIQGNECNMSYADKGGKYINDSKSAMIPKV